MFISNSVVTLRQHN